MTNEGDLYPTYTRDSWTIPEDGAVIWCNGWGKDKKIKPYGDGYHVYVNGCAYHCDELMEILTRWGNNGYKWGINGVNVEREQEINGRWTPVKL